MTPIEKAAQAARDEFACKECSVPHIAEPMYMLEGGLTSERDWQDLARAVLRAIRDPSEGMLAAAELVDHPGPGETDTVGEWQAMIDAALAEANSPPAKQ